MGGIQVIADCWTVAEELWSYGEDEHWRRALAFTDAQLDDVGKRAGVVMSQGKASSTGHALAQAAVEALEGRRRPLKRQRRRPRKLMPHMGAPPSDEQISTLVQRALSVD